MIPFMLVQFPDGQYGFQPCEPGPEVDEASRALHGLAYPVRLPTVRQYEGRTFLLPVGSETERFSCALSAEDWARQVPNGN
jgi:hypothetical protein